jgi:chromosome segregation ATPase
MQQIIDQQKNEIDQAVTQLQNAIATLSPLPSHRPSPETASLQGTIISLQEATIQTQRIIAEEDRKNKSQQAIIERVVAQLRAEIDQSRDEIDQSRDETAPLRDAVNRFLPRLQEAASKETVDQMRIQIEQAVTQLRNETDSLPAAINPIVTQLQAEITQIQRIIAQKNRAIDQQKKQIDQLENPSWGEAIRRLFTPRRAFLTKLARRMSTLHVL